MRSWDCRQLHCTTLQGWGPQSASQSVGRLVPQAQGTQAAVRARSGTAYSCCGQMHARQ